MVYIRALKNFRKADTMEILLKYAEGKARKPAIYATRALQTMPESYITEKVRVGNFRLGNLSLE